MGTVNIEIAKRMSKAPKNAPGISLRSIKGDVSEVSMIIMAGSYELVREAVKSYGSRTGAQISCAMRGKSFEIKSMSFNREAIAHLLDFAKCIRFNTEEALDVVEFFENPCFKAVSIDLDTESMRLIVEAPEDKAQYDVLSSTCDKYRMGIMMERPESWQ